MAEDNNVIGAQNLFEQNVGMPTRDENIPISDILANLNGTKTEVKTEETVEKDDGLSPLERLKAEKEAGTQGMIVTNQELEDGREKAPDKNIIYNDTRMGHIHNKAVEMDESIKKRNAVVLLKQPMNQTEYIQLMIELDSVKFDENGKAYLDYQPDSGMPTEPIYVRIREEGEEINDFKSLDEQFKQNPSNGEVVEGDEEEKELSEAAKQSIQVIIDKTGLGADFAFTDEEKEKLTEAEVIQVKEVKVVSLASVRSKRIDRSFQDVVKEFNYTGNKVTIFFPASGFKAQMKGLTYGEYSDIALSMDNVTFDQYHKRLSIIYNKMTNVSTGPFKDFEDFLRRFAYTDIPLAVYGLFVATENDNQSIQLRCGNNACNKSFDWKYTTRSLLRLNKCAEVFLEKMRTLVTAEPSQYDEIGENAVVNNSLTIELPYSKFVVEIGIASAYDFLYNFIPLMDEKTFKEAFGENANEAVMANILLLTSVRAVFIPEADGYIECEGYKDILDAIYQISPEEIKIITAYASKFQGDYEIVFGFADVICPHCKRKTNIVEISMDELVFQTYQRLMNTEIDLPKPQDL